MKKAVLEIELEVPDVMDDSEVKETIEAILELSSRHELDCMGITFVGCKWPDKE